MPSLYIWSLLSFSPSPLHSILFSPLERKYVRMKTRKERKFKYRASSTSIIIIFCNVTITIMVAVYNIGMLSCSCIYKNKWILTFPAQSIKWSEHSTGTQCPSFFSSPSAFAYVYFQKLAELLFSASVQFGMCWRWLGILRIYCGKKFWEFIREPEPKLWVVSCEWNHFFLLFSPIPIY